MIGDRFRWLRTKCGRIFHRSAAETALDAELQFHFDQLVAEFGKEGMSEKDARLAAQREFGAATAAYREEIRDAWRPPRLADLWRTLRFAVRSLVRSPGFTILAIVTLALGIGANTAMVSGFRTIFLKPLPYAKSEQLDRIDRATPQNPAGRVSPADFLDLKRDTSGYGEVSAYALADTSLSEPGQAPEMASAIKTTANFLSTLGVQPQIGRDFRAQEEVLGNDRVVIISQRFWKNRFGGRTDIIGRVVRVDGQPNEIVGVLPESFNDWRHLGWVDLIRPLALDQGASMDRRSTILRLIGRRSEKLSRIETDRFIANFGAHQASEFPEANAGSTWHTVPLNETIQGKSGRSMLGMCIGLSGFVLLIGCSNLANLLLARTIGRAREFAVRSALGASRRQLLLPLVTESLLLALAGGICAILVAHWVGDWLAVRSTGDNGESVILIFDWPVLGWAFLASLGTAVAFGLAPALLALRLNLSDTLKSGARGATGGRGHQRFRHFLIIGQFALVMILLSGAALFIRGLDELNHRRSGWESAHLVTGTIVLPTAGYGSPDKINAFHRLALERLESVPGAASASLSTFTPFFNWSDTRKYLVEGRDLPQRGHEPTAVVNDITPNYFSTFGTRVLAGRAFTGEDNGAAPKVFIINQTMASGLFGKEDPIGRRLAQAGGPELQWGEIVGVVADERSVVPDPGPISFQLYQPMAQEPASRNEIALRTIEVAPATVIDQVRAVMAALDPDLPVRELQPADTTIERANYQSAVLRDMLGGFAVLGLALASMGLYGVIARTMAQRTSEFAIRFALGARVRDITRIGLVSGVKLALIGSMLGLIGALGVARVLAAGNPGMQLNSPLVLVCMSLLLIGVALVASWMPARRAARLNPVEALRMD